jgi:O-antigen/teichoic acid export membrane protein
MLAVIPVLTGSMGPERFGVFSLFWAIVAAIRIMDFGVSRATTKYVAEYRSTERRGEIPDLVWSSMAVHILIGVVLGLLVLLLYPATRGLLGIPPALANETANAVIVLACGIPFLLLLASLRSTVEGCQQFRAYNVIHVTWELVAFVGLAVLAKLHFSMPVLIGQLILARAGCGILLAPRRLLPGPPR